MFKQLKNFILTTCRSLSWAFFSLGGVSITFIWFYLETELCVLREKCNGICLKRWLCNLLWYTTLPDSTVWKTFLLASPIPSDAIFYINFQYSANKMAQSYIQIMHAFIYTMCTKVAKENNRRLLATGQLCLLDGWWMKERLRFMVANVTTFHFWALLLASVLSYKPSAALKVALLPIYMPYHDSHIDRACVRLVRFINILSKLAGKFEDESRVLTRTLWKAYWNIWKSCQGYLSTRMIWNLTCFILQT